ncbi:dihydrolipoamide acetyltransferase component of pyruvate dehydrogenase complex [Alicyclobacillus contaminans]|uniref:dihydrolipoamide acetyltransferase family protein n=1 Tax=Alicyclobacillus contaminans TaxID=392016 RepID=UPI00041B7087|nr:dihydrolipoamide acetyltransferase family protein [Alicyclobacillus contaminans]GMA50848.1 dihydrolipoamide acetyltransferase component of pyruvate dehydrogenase complex [Alicyclobacillus contaminans]
MAKEVLMPKLGMTQETGTILQWFKQEGDPVEKGEPLLEVMTDKINIEVESYESGVLLKKYYEIDDVVPVNQVIAYIGSPGEPIPDHPVPLAQQPGNNASDSATSEVGGTADGVSAVPGKVRATPAARAAARKYGVNLHALASGLKDRRIYRRDVDAFVRNQGQVTSAPVAETSPSVKPPAKPANPPLRSDALRSSSDLSDAQVVHIQGIRRVIGDRMSQSAFTAPHVTLVTEVDMGEVVHLRETLLPVIQAETGERLSYTEIIVKGVAHALRKHPSVNAWMREDHMVLHQRVHVGVAVDTEAGLMVPVVRDADEKGLADLTRLLKDLARRARAQRLSPDEISGSTFTVSNLGMYAVDAFTPIINAPETAILGVGRMMERPVGRNGQIVLRPMMALSLSFDHRALDGAPAAAFLTELKTVLEQPSRLLV